MVEARRKRLVGLMSACGVCGAGGLEKTCGPSGEGFNASGIGTWTGGERRCVVLTPMRPCENRPWTVGMITVWSARP